MSNPLLKTTAEQHAQLRRRLNGGNNSWEELTLRIVDDADTAAQLQEEVKRLQAREAALVQALATLTENAGVTNINIAGTRILYCRTRPEDSRPPEFWHVHGTDYPTAQEAIQAALETILPPEP